MKRLLRIGIVTLAAAVVLFAAFHFVRAQGKGSQPLVVPSTTRSDPAVPHVLFWTYLTGAYSSYTELSPAETWIPIDSQTKFTCLLPCTLEVEQTDYVGDNYTPGNWWGLGFSVDSGSPYWLQEPDLPTDGAYWEAIWVWSLSLGAGSHTVQSFAESYKGAGYSLAYHMTYRVYAP